jgi:hypothetical protein
MGLSMINAPIRLASGVPGSVAIAPTNIARGQHANAKKAVAKKAMRT